MQWRKSCERRMYRSVVLLLRLGAVGLALLTLAGCSILPAVGAKRVASSPSAAPNPSAGRLMVAASLASIPASELADTVVRLTLVKDGQIRTAELPVVDAEVSATLDNLLPGVWEVTLQLADTEGAITYEARDSVSIVGGQSASLSLVLKPLPGVLEVTVDPSSHSDLASVQRGRLYVNPGGYSTMEENPDGTLTGTKELAPGTYDFSIALYSESFYARDRVYESPWSPVTVTAGKTTRVVWNPTTGTCTVIGRVDAPPPTPTGLQLVKVAQGLQISWEPVPDIERDLVCYRIYFRDSIFDKFDVIYEADADRTSFLYPSSELTAGKRVEVVVTAVDASEQESDRSPVASIDW